MYVLSRIRDCTTGCTNDIASYPVVMVIARAITITTANGYEATNDIDKLSGHVSDAATQRASICSVIRRAFLGVYSEMFKYLKRCISESPTHDQTMSSTTTYTYAEFDFLNFGAFGNTMSESGCKTRCCSSQRMNSQSNPEEYFISDANRFECLDDPQTDETMPDQTKKRIPGQILPQLSNLSETGRHFDTWITIAPARACPNSVTPMATEPGPRW